MRKRYQINTETKARVYNICNRGPINTAQFASYKHHLQTYTPLLFCLHNRPQNLGKKSRNAKKSKNAKKAENARSISKFIQKYIKNGKKKAHLFEFFSLLYIGHSTYIFWKLLKTMCIVFTIIFKNFT